jgi:predicted transposase/invertase (TIGR01784 family)
MPCEEGYDKRQRKYMLEFTGRIFRLGDPRISEDLKEAYKLQTISLEQYVAEIDKEEARMEGMEKGMEKGKFEVARNFLKMGLPLDQIAQGTGLSIEEISAIC